MSAPLLVSDKPGPQITTRPLSVGCLIFPQMDQIDFTGPFEVLSRMPDTTIRVVAKELVPICDIQGLRFMPDTRVEEAGTFDVLVVPGGYGQQALMRDEEVLALIRRHVQSERLLFSVCTGALLCGAAGVLRGRHRQHIGLRSRCCLAMVQSSPMQGGWRTATSSTLLA
jgi:cyclohexyl-isocyanide hydratase